MTATVNDLKAENERLKREVARLTLKLAEATEQARDIQQAVQLANCKAMGLINELQDTKR